jgi:peptidoglycan/LPS O-acetylase OafA/YrhL
VAFIGVLSYSLYLVHGVLLEVVMWKLPHASHRGVIVLTASIIVAWTIYRVVEKPCARLRRRLTDW